MRFLICTSNASIGMSNNILYIWDSDYPWDVRAEKICQSLVRHGFESHIAARNLKKRPCYEKIDGIHVHRIRNWDSSKLNYALSFPAFFSPVWKSFINTIVRKHNIRLIIVRDLPLVPLGISCGRKFRIPCIFDMAEDYVAMIRDIWNARKFQGLNLVVRNPYLAKLVERYSLKNADHILVVVDEAVDVVVRGGGSADKVTVVSNTPELDKINQAVSANLNFPELEKIWKQFSAIYVGGIQMGRGIQTVLDAIPQIIREIPDFLFVVVGDGYATPYFKQLVKKRNLDEYVEWIGWVGHDRIYNYIKACKVGIIPHLVTDHVNTTIPNKIFDYMALGLPVVATDAAPMKRVLEKEKCGVVFESNNPMRLYQAIVELKNKATDLGKNGICAIRSKYNWSLDEKRLIRLLNKLIK